MPKGKTPSLIGASLGRPKKVTCGRSTPCSRCRKNISKGATCYDVPRINKPHASTRRFCQDCFDEVLEQTRQDLSSFC